MNLSIFIGNKSGLALAMQALANKKFKTTKTNTTLLKLSSWRVFFFKLLNNFRSVHSCAEHSFKETFSNGYIL
jgi:hypothetical protein